MTFTCVEMHVYIVYIVQYAQMFYLFQHISVLFTVNKRIALHAITRALLQVQSSPSSTLALNMQCITVCL